MDEGCKKVKTIRNLHSDLNFLPLSPSPIFKPTHLLNDNQGSVDWSHGYGTKKMKHLNIWEMCVGAAQELGNIEISHIPGILNLLISSQKSTGTPAIFAHFVTSS